MTYFKKFKLSTPVGEPVTAAGTWGTQNRIVKIKV